MVETTIQTSGGANVNSRIHLHISDNYLMIV